MEIELTLIGRTHIIELMRTSLRHSVYLFQIFLWYVIGDVAVVKTNQIFQYILIAAVGHQHVNLLHEHRLLIIEQSTAQPAKRHSPFHGIAFYVEFPQSILPMSQPVVSQTGTIRGGCDGKPTDGGL